ncbi:MAG: endonuclease/exonuclease/phosphatase family protein [Pontiellaceae bacterium]|nr:endonuclease/exonuclease/phosphatase family protein [Pontiellaceae bacterium]
MFNPKNHPRLRERFLRDTWIIVALLALVSLLGLAGRLHWTLDLFSHFRVQYAQLALIGAGICLWVRFNKVVLAFIALFLLNYAFIFPLYLGKPDAPTQKPHRAMLMNINANNGNTDQVLDAVEDFAPDLLLLEEVTPKWVEELAPLNELFPYRIAQPQTDCFGIMLLSKYPLTEGVVVEIGDGGVPSIIADVNFPDGTITLIGTHPLPPIGSAYSAHRNRQLKELAAVAKSQRKPVLVMGDLNTTPWSPYFRNLLRDSGLHDSTKGFGFQPTWSPSIRFLKIPIDHMLYSSGIRVWNRVVGPKVGSDHLPVVMDFEIQ